MCLTLSKTIYMPEGVGEGTIKGPGSSFSACMTSVYRLEFLHMYCLHGWLTYIEPQVNIPTHTHNVGKGKVSYCHHFSPSCLQKMGISDRLFSLGNAINCSVAEERLLMISLEMTANN